MATKEIKYISYADAALLHIELMSLYGETRRGVFERSLVESALARPRQAAAYEGADLIRQAATLCFGMIRNHPWVGGNKRSATAIMARFLLINGVAVDASPVTQLKWFSRSKQTAGESMRWRVGCGSASGTGYD